MHVLSPTQLWQFAVSFILLGQVALAATVTIDAGVVVGTQSSISGSPTLVNQYLAVPFAASPTRFSPPQTPTPWSSPLQATRRGPACIQQFNYPEAIRNFSMMAFNNPPPQESEDCLNLNIFAPAGAEQSNTTLKAVMFWIYGGSLQMGYAGLPAYDGSSFAANQDVIVVTTNYRTNVFGFPGALSLPSTQRNLGYLDQRFALAWVQRNIRAFGGDPNRVTIFGESAGAFSVDALLTSYNRSTKPPFYAAITESGQSSVAAGSLNNGSDWNFLISALNCSSQNFSSDLACARAAPAATLKSIEEHAALRFGASIDNYTYIYQPNRARAANRTYPVPLLSGTNSGEGSIFTFTFTNTTAFLTNQGFPSAYIPTILAAYPRNATNQAGQLMSSDYNQIEAIFTDLVFQCPAAIATNTSQSVGIPTWRYFYNATFPNVVPIPGLALNVSLGAWHSSEITTVFGTYSLYGNATAQQRRLSEYMQTSWATFAKNPTGGPGWSASPSVQVLGGPGGFVVNGNGSSLYKRSTPGVLDGGRCAIWLPAYQATSGA